MPISSESTPPLVNFQPSAEPYYVRQTQPWAIQQEHMRHNQALYSIGEYAMFCLRWSAEDFDNGLVQRCSRCQGVQAADWVHQQVAGTYKQPEQARCFDCFGTNFEGGFRALLIRPAIFTDTDEAQEQNARGVIQRASLMVESTTDFRVRKGDYVFRGNGQRFQLGAPQRVQLRTGFGMPDQDGTAVGYNHTRAVLEDETSVAYDIPPYNTPGGRPGPDSTSQVKVRDTKNFPLQTLPQILAQVTQTPTDFAIYETVRGPLIPPNQSTLED